MGKRIVIALGGNCPTGRFAPRGAPPISCCSGGSEFRLRQGFARRAKRCTRLPARGAAAPRSHPLFVFVR